MFFFIAKNSIIYRNQDLKSTNNVQSQKIVCVIRSRYCQNVKRGAHLWDQLFSVYFFVTNMGQIVPYLNKNRIFQKSTKT